jgi:hypothetical protein
LHLPAWPASESIRALLALGRPVRYERRHIGGNHMSKVTVVCVCILVSALAVVIRIHNLEQGLARAAYAACNSKDNTLLRLVRSDSVVP